MSKIVSDNTANIISKKLQKLNVKIYKTDIIKVYLCRLNRDFTPMFNTNLYKLHGGDYCKLLEIIEDYFTD